MGIKQLHNDNLRKLPNEYGEESVMQGILLLTERGHQIVNRTMWNIEFSFMIISKFGVFYSNFLSLDSNFLQSNSQLFLENSIFTPVFKVLVRTLEYR